jgi:hypothetical protein
MGDWLVDKGLDAPRAARPKAPPSMNALHRRQGQFRAAPFGPPHASASRAMGKQVTGSLSLHDLQCCLPSASFDVFPARACCSCHSLAHTLDFRLEESRLHVEHRGKAQGAHM